MPASCPFCGATLNFGLKFCVVCGRHTAVSEMTKMGSGLRAGIRPADMTRRLDENLSSSHFERARKPTRLRRQVKSLSEKFFYSFITLALFFCAVRFTLQNFFPNKLHQVLHPILGKNSAAVEETLTGKSTPDTSPTPEETAAQDQADKQKADAQANAKKQKPKKKRSRHHRK